MAPRAWCNRGMPGYRALIFDLGGVILPLDYERGYAAIAPACGLPVEEIPRRIAATGLIEPFETGRIGGREFARRIGEALGLKLTYEEFCKVWSAIFPPETLIREELFAELAGLYRLLLLSNTNEIHFEYIRKNYGFVRYFDDFVVSYEVGAMKPAPEIYRAAIRAAGCAPQECFFTDDVPENVEAARRHGIDAAVFTSEQRLRGELERRGILLRGASGG